MGATGKILSILGLFVLMSFHLFSQSGHVQVFLVNSEEPISLAHIKFKSIAGQSNNEFKWCVTDEKGIAINPYMDTTIVLVTYPGFEDQSFSLLPNEFKTIYLSPTVQEVGEVVVTAQFVPVEIENSIY